MKKLKKQDIILFIISILFSLIIFSKWIQGHLAADTYRIIDLGYQKYAIDFSLTDGRIINAVICYISHLLNLPIMWFVIILKILAIITSCIVIIILKNIVLKYKKLDNQWQIAFLVLVCYFTIFNFTYLENMYFIECFVMSLSLLFYLLASYDIVEKTNKCFFKSSILLYLGLISYQGTISAFFVFTVLFSMLKQENFKEIIKNFFKALCIFLVGFLLNSLGIFLVQKIFHTVQLRGSSLSSIFANIAYILSQFNYVLIHTCFLFPQYVYLFFIVFIFVIVCIKLIIQNNKFYNANLQQILLEHFFIIILSISCAFIPSIYNTTAFSFGRIRFTLGALIGLLFIHLIVKTDLLKCNVKLDKILIGIFITYSIITSYNYISFINLTKEVNLLEENQAYEIKNYISDYEEENKIQVKNICVVVVPNNTFKAINKNLNQKYFSFLTVDAIRTEWSCQGTVNYYANKKLLRRTANSEEINNYFQQVDTEKEYCCLGDTLFVTCYFY